jgi:hypothetical protein
VSTYGEKLIAALSLAFAIWRWWVYREAILHKRLEEYILESDKRLEPSSVAVVEALLRPGRTASLPHPAFARELRRVLIRHRWRERLSAYSHLSFESQVHWKLGSALRGIRGRIATAQKAVASLQSQQANIHMIAGAISASRARKGMIPTMVLRQDAAALREFRRVLQVPGFQRNCHAKENEGFQLLRLGSRQLALSAYEELEEFGTTIQDQRTRELTLARAKRFQAQIHQANGNPGIADGLMRGTTGALILRTSYQPFHEWDAIEQAEMHYVQAWIAHRLGFVLIEAHQLDQCHQAYDLVLHQLPSRNSLVSQDVRALRAEAAIGRERARVARKDGQFDEEWLRA